jgi:hypothetical protein
MSARDLFARPGERSTQSEIHRSTDAPPSRRASDTTIAGKPSIVNTELFNELCVTGLHLEMRSMDRFYNWKNVGGELKVFAVWIASSIMDSVFVAIWVLLQWFVSEKVIHGLRLSGVDTWVLGAFQVLFAMSTLVPVVIYIYVDIRIMILRAQQMIRLEIQDSEENKPYLD